jgi:hypothetical protein
MLKLHDTSQSGFVLVSVLWVLVIMALAASAFSVWVDRVREQAFLRQHQMEAYQKSTDALTKVIYTYMTGIKTSEGVAWPAASGAAPITQKFSSLDDFMAGAAATVTAGAAGFMRMDGAVLDITDGIHIMVQDRAGLIGLSFLSDITVFDNIASKSGDRLTGERLRDTLSDYQDGDSIRRIQGAESFEYHQQKRPTPLNGLLRSPLQLRDVMDWDSILDNVDDAWILRVFRNEGAAAINVNTAYRDALGLVINDENALSALLAGRELQSYKGVSELTKFLAGSEDIKLSILPAAGFRFWWWRQGDTTARVYDVQFDPLNSGSKAWYFNWTARVNLPDDLANSTAKTIDHPFFD